MQGRSPDQAIVKDGISKDVHLRPSFHICEFYQSLDKSNMQKLPAVFPLLLYNGDAKWTAESSFENLIEPTIPGRYVPRFEYFKVLENEFSPDVLFQIRNVVSAVFYIENSGIEMPFKRSQKAVYYGKG
ncbi:Rpn family recombination-promoting nuclease/putative transposase [Oceanispirochaeta sp. M2]|uniref:Rpn family recombination-promoting nuclease/putative transposase n=1 Tax=Oceanispirochaeta sp. M2 TaxID=2735869 RepID=UPI000E0973E0|nr:Rpn family recombination-promoting nuclease/putative transposase [Oceanispirochaeta sp. M2]